VEIKKIMQKHFFSVLLTFLVSQTILAQGHGPHNLNKAGIAIEGYDPVAYFKQAKAIEGGKEFGVTVDGVRYLFSSAQNAAIFKADPAKYQPQYGGWCAYAMGATGEKVEIDPETFKIIDGKLYLYYNRFFNNTLKSWNKDEANLKQKADANWKKLNQ
jgi:YHS domain-containing protein